MAYYHVPLNLAEANVDSWNLARVLPNVLSKASSVSVLCLMHKTRKMGLNRS